MNFAKVITEAVGALEAAHIRYALIGGFAMAMRGVQRATVDLDFILLLDDLEKADRILTSFGYTRTFRSENVSHYLSADGDWGRIDLLHAFRGPSLGMLDRADCLTLGHGIAIKVVQVEDIIGLKIQALSNDPSRLERDWYDIRLLVRAAREHGSSLDWELIDDYLALFHLEGRIAELRQLHGSIE